jgi:hypothetical protein
MFTNVVDESLMLFCMIYFGMNYKISIENLLLHRILDYAYIIVRKLNKCKQLNLIKLCFRVYYELCSAISEYCNLRFQYSLKFLNF